jgi:hypothetical protein
MTMQRYITYKAASVSQLPNIIPPIFPNSPYFPTLAKANNTYAPNNRNDPDSACSGYLPTFKGFLTIIGDNFIIVPLSQTHPCYVEYKRALNKSYNTAISTAKDRIIAENAAVNYIDLTLINIMLNSSQNFYNI